MIKSQMNKVALFLLLGFSISNAFATDEWDINLSGFLGHKKLKQSDWPGVDSQASFGLLFNAKKASWPFSLAVDYISSEEAFDINIGSLNVTSQSSELHLGIRKIFNSTKSSFNPYVGGGIAHINGKIKQRDVNGNSEDDNNQIGFWLGTGVYYQFNSNMLLGLDLRYSDANGKVFNVERELGGFHSGITIGYSW